MKITYSYIFSVTAFLFAVGALGAVEPADVPYVPTAGETAAGLDEVVDAGRLRRSVECYPTEIYYGDTVYVSEYLENVSDENIGGFSLLTPLPAWNLGCSFKITSPQIDGSYSWTYEAPTDIEVDYAPHYIPLKPHVKYCRQGYCLDFCPLQDYNDPFWKELREKMTPDGIVCTLTYSGRLGEDWLGDKSFTYSQDILVKLRPENEMSLLEEWYKNTPQEFFPNGRRSTSGRAAGKGKSDVRFSKYALSSYDPWLFIPVGNRKPSVPNNPRTLEGWRELEASLVPSTLRDEIRLTRLRLEYFAAEDGEPAAQAKQEYSDWLKSLPRTQRDVMSSYDYESVLSRDQILKLNFGKRYLEFEKERYNELARDYLEFMQTIAEQKKNNPAGVGTSAQNDVPAISHVVFFGVRGGSRFLRQAKTPGLETIFKDCRYNTYVKTRKPMRDAECWASMLHGVTAEFHERTARNIESKPYPVDSPYPSVFRVLREELTDAKLASFCNWNPINIGMIEDDLGVVKGTAETDAELTELVCKYLEENDPTFLFVEFDECEQTRLAKGYGAPEHLRQIEATDGYIQKIYDAIAKRGVLDSTLFVFFTDYGEDETDSNRRFIPGVTDAVKYGVLTVAGSGVSGRFHFGEMEVLDVPAIVLAALDLADKQPKSWTSRVPDRLFKVDVPRERPDNTIPYAYEHRTRPNKAVRVAYNVPHAPDRIGLDRVLLHMPFDQGFNGAPPIVAGITAPGLKRKVDGQANVNGELGFSRRGYFGEAVCLGAGSLSYKIVERNKDSFSVALWFNANYIGGEPCIISNKSWSESDGSGFAFTLRPPYIEFKVGSESNNRTLGEFKLPEDYRNGWVYVALVVDREEGVVRASYDFEDFTIVELPKELGDVDLTLGSSIDVGRDASGETNDTMELQVDEFLLIDGALTKEDLNKLKEFYHMDPDKLKL